MKNYKLIAIFYFLLFPLYSNAQLADISNGYSSIINFDKKAKKANTNEVPNCSDINLATYQITTQKVYVGWDFRNQNEMNQWKDTVVTKIIPSRTILKESNTQPISVEEGSSSSFEINCSCCGRTTPLNTTLKTIELELSMLSSGCTLTIRRKCVLNNGSVVYSNWTTVTIPPIVPPIQEPNKPKCGDPFQAVNISNTNPLSSLTSLDWIHINGMPVLMDSVVGSNGNFSGIGQLFNPFSEKPIKVNFQNLKVNSDRVVYGGEMKGVKATSPINFNSPNSNLSMGGEICVKKTIESEDEDGFNKLTGMNARGFKRDSLYYPDSTRYDPNGFDFEGKHKDTGNQYDRNGCDMYGNGSDGQPCKINPVDAAMRDSLKSVISDNMNQVLNLLKGNILDSLNKFNCTQLLQDLRDICVTNGLDTLWYFGVDSKYVNPGMSNYFIKEPQALLNNSCRNDVAIEVEKKHIALYQCDLIKTKYQSLQTKILSCDTNLLKAFLKDRIGGLTAGQLDQFRLNPSIYNEWINNQITEFLNQPTVGSHIPRRNKPSTIILNNLESFGLECNSGTESSAHSVKEISDNRKWQFDQNLPEIDGISRANYLEDLYHKYNALAKLPTSNSQDTSFNLMPMRLPIFKNGVPYHIYLDNLTLTPTTSTVDAYFLFEEPNSGKKLVLSAINVPFGKGGVMGDIKLQLNSSVEIRVSNAVKLRLLPTNTPGGGTFVSWDCSGFKSIAIKGQLELCREYITPLDPITMKPKPEPARYAIDFNMELSDWSNFYFDVNSDSIKPFALTNFEDYKWTAHNLAVDFSDYRSPISSPMFPGYTHPEYLNNAFNLGWRGIYFEELSCVLPNKFSADTTSALTVGIKNSVFDDRGFSGLIFATNILSTNSGSIAGWPFSIDTFQLTFCQNELFGGGMAGMVKIPLFESFSRYNASINKNNKYSFSISPNENEEMNLLLADVTISRNSSIKITHDDLGFEARATLFGTLNIGTGSSTSQLNNLNVKLPRINFNGLNIGSRAPYFEAGIWTIDQGVDIAMFGFGLKIDNIKPVQPTTTEVGLGFNLEVDLVQACNISAKGDFEVLGQLSADDIGRQKWIFKRMKVNDLSLEASFSGCKLNGRLTTYENHPEFGKGFQGMAELQIDKIGKIQAMAMFGKKAESSTQSAYKYFFVDAAMSLKNGIPIGVLDINGFVGGMAYNMKYTPTMDYSKLYQSSTGTTGSNSQPTSLPPLGQTFSGSSFSPNDTYGLYLKAGVNIGLKNNARKFNALVTLQMLFNRHLSDGTGGGLREITLEGIGQFMNDFQISNIPTSGNTTLKPIDVEGPLTAYVSFKYNFPSSNQGGEFIGKINTFLRLNTSFGSIYGNGGNDKLITADLYAGPRGWWIYVGTPEQRCGIQLNSGIINAELTAYLDIGTKVPNMPALPANVSSIAGQIRSSQSLRSSGSGFALGAALVINATFDFGIGSAELDAGVGFDLFVREFKNAKCRETGQPFGINSWYGMGQFWAYLSGKLKIWGINVLEAGIVAVLQGQFPNPFYAQASVSVYIDTFLDNWTETFDVKLGEYCTIVEDHNTPNPLGIKVISNINPPSEIDNIEPDFRPEVNFSVNVNQIFEMTTQNGVESFDVKEPRYKLQSTSNPNLTYPFKVKYNNDKTNGVIYPDNFFFSRDTVKLNVEVDVYKNGVLITTERDSTTFRIGEAVSSIPLSNIESSYPYDGMVNYYKHENNRYRGFIQLKQGMPELFYNIPEGKEIKIRLSKPNGDTKYIDVEYFPLTARVEWPMDPEWLDNGSIYRLELIYTPNSNITTALPIVGFNANSLTSNINFSTIGGIGLDPTSHNENIEISEDPYEQPLYEAYFRVSKFKTFSDKMSKLGSSAMIDSWSIQRSNYEEPFGRSERTLSIKTKLIMDNSKLAQKLDTIYGLVSPFNYIQYYRDPIGHCIMDDNNYTSGEFGLKPTRFQEIDENFLDLNGNIKDITQSDFNNHFNVSGGFSIVNNIESMISYDFNFIHSELKYLTYVTTVDNSCGEPFFDEPRAQHIFKNEYEPLPSDYHIKTRFSYIIPGLGKTSEVIVDFIKSNY